MIAGSSWRHCTFSGFFGLRIPVPKQYQPHNKKWLRFYLDFFRKIPPSGFKIRKSRAFCLKAPFKETERNGACPQPPIPISPI